MVNVTCVQCTAVFDRAWQCIRMQHEEDPYIQKHRTRDLKAAADHVQPAAVNPCTDGVGQAVATSCHVLGVIVVAVEGVLRSKVLREVAVQETLFLARAHNLEHNRIYATTLCLRQTGCCGALVLAVRPAVCAALWPLPGMLKCLHVTAGTRLLEHEQMWQAKSDTKKVCASASCGVWCDHL